MTTPLHDELSEGTRWLDGAPGGAGQTAPDRGRARTAANGDETALAIREGTLRDSEELLRRVMGTSHDCIKLLDLEGRLLWMNACGLRVMEIEDFQPLQNTPWLEFWNGDDHGAACAAVETAKAGGMGSFTGFCPTTKGVPKWWDVVVTPILNDANQPEKLLAVSRDMTERMQAEAALRESEARFRELAENIHEVFWITDLTKTQMLYISPAYEKIWGRTCQSLYESPRNWLDAIRPEDRARVIQAALTKQALGTYDEEYRIHRPDGVERWIRDRAFPVRDADGTIMRCVGIAEDITESKKLQEQLLRAQRMEAIGTLAGGIAHDLNNILAPVLMAPTLLRGATRSDHERHLLDLIEQSAQRGSNIVRQLLTFSRGSGGERVSVQLRHLLKEMTDIMQETFPRDIAVDDHATRDLRPIVGDPTQLHQVIMNLCVNARDAMANGGKLSLVAKNVELSAAEVQAHPSAKPGAYVKVSVTDTGHGIPPEIAEHIFDPFFTTKPPGKGTGLGLSTVLGIVRSHGGFITVTSTPGHGTTFTIHLPAAPEAGEAAIAADRNALPDGHGELILVVDDEEFIRTSTRLILEQRGYRVLTASEGAEAFATFLQNRDAVQLVLIDVMMPVMGGVPLIRALRAAEPKLKILATTGLADQATLDEVGAAGVTGIMAKPFGPRELLDAIREELAPSS